MERDGETHDNRCEMDVKSARLRGVFLRHLPELYLQVYENSIQVEIPRAQEGNASL